MNIKRKRVDWDEALEMFSNFVSTHQRFPSAESSDPDECFIGKWIRTQREARTAQRDSKHTERAAKLDAVVPEWRDAQFFNEREWMSNLEHLAVFVAETGRMPSTVTPQEKRIGNWRTTQLMHLKRGVIKPHRIALLNERVPGWSTKQGAQRPQ